MRPIAAALALLALPVVAVAASSFTSARALLVASSSLGNLYAAGGSAAVTAPVAGDLTLLGGAITLAAPVEGDAFLLGGRADVRAKIGGDLRAAGGALSIEAPVAGDLVATGFSVADAARSLGSVFIIARDASLSAGARGPVTVYANNVTLGGDFADEVRVVASGRVALAPGTTIAGAFSYEAPEAALIPPSAAIKGGVHYTSTSYLPSAGALRALSFLSLGILFVVRVLGALILAGLVAGLFPRPGEALAERALGRARETLLTMLLGFAAIVAVPLLLLLLALTLVGAGLALLIAALYALLLILAFAYAGVLIGALVARRFERRTTLLWRDGVAGMFALSLIALVPVVGSAILFLFVTFTAGGLLLLFFRYAFPHEDETPVLL